MMDAQKSPLELHNQAIINLILFPISTDHFFIQVYFSHFLIRGLLVHASALDLIFHAALLLALILFTLPFFFVKEFKPDDLSPSAHVARSSIRSSLKIVDLYGWQIRRGFSREEIRFAKWNDSRFIERSSVLRRLIFLPERLFSERGSADSSDVAQLHHDIGHSIGRDYVQEKAAFFIVVDLVLFYTLHGRDFDLTTYAGIWVELSFAVFLFLAFARYSAFLHAREYRADVYGYNQIGDQMIQFLKDGAQLERHFVHGTRIKRLIGQLTHPSFEKRLRRLTVCMPDALNCSELRRDAQTSVLHSVLLFVGAWANISWATLILLGSGQISQDFSSGLSLAAVMLLCLLAIGITVRASSLQAERMRQVSKIL